MRDPLGASTRTRRPRASGSTRVASAPRATGTSTAASRAKIAGDRRVAQIKAANAKRRQADPIIDVPATLKYLKDNPAEAGKLYAEMVADPFGARDVARAIRERDAAGGALAVAGAVPMLPGGKVAAAAGKVARVAKTASTAAKASKAAKSGQTIADAIGPAKAASVRAAAGAPKAVAPKKVRVPKTKPVEPKTKAAKERYWNETVPAWNKANPGDKIKIPTSGPTVGKAATDTRRQVAQSDAAKTPAEAATVTAGRRQAAKATSKARGARTRAAKAQDSALPQKRNPRSKTKVMPESSKPPVKAVDAMMPDVRKAAAARTKALREDGPSRKDLGVGGRDKAAAKATDERVANFQQRLADVRASRNRGDMASYETQEVVGAGTVPKARPVRPSVKTPKQVTREGLDTERKTRGGMTRIDQGARAADVKSGGKQGKMAASGEKITRTQVAKYKKQYDPQGGNPLDPKTDLSKYPASVREYMVQARAENSSLDRTAQNVNRLMQPEGRNPGTGARTPTGSKGADQVPMNKTADQNLRAKNPRKGLGKGSQSKAKPAESTRTKDGKPVRGTGKFKPETDKVDGPGIRGTAASDGSTLPTTKGRSVTGSGDGTVTDSGYPGLGDVSGRVRGARAPRKVDTSSPAQKPPGDAVKKPAAKKPSAKKPKTVAQREADQAKRNNAPGKGTSPKAIVDAVVDTAKSATKKTVNKPSTKAQPSKPASMKPASKPKAKDETPDNVTPISAAKGKPKKGKAKPAAGEKPKGPFLKGRNTGRTPDSNPYIRNPRMQRAEMARDLLKGRGAKKIGSKGVAAGLVAAGGAAAYAKVRGDGKATDATASSTKPVTKPNDTKTDTKPKRKPVMTEKDGDKYVLDQYGRRISPAEYKRRLAEKKARENAKTPEERLRLYKQQVARRQKYRSSKAATSKYGKRASKVTKKPSVRVGQVLRREAKK